MVELPTKPTITCGIGSVPVAVVATYAGGIFPITGAKVSFKAAFFGFYGGGDVFYTDVLGIAQNCYVLSAIGLGAFIQKDGIDFGDGVGAEHFIGDSGIRTGPYMFPKVIARTSTPGVKLPPVVTPPPVTIPCFGTLSVSQPNFFEMLNIKPPLPPNIYVSPVTATVNNKPENIPIKIYVDGREYPFAASANTGLDVIRIIKYFGAAEIDKGHTIRIDSAKTDCNISPSTGSFSVPPLIPALSALPSPCTSWDTTANISVPSVLQAPFNIAITDAFWICRATGDKIPVTVPAEVIIAGQRFTIPLG